MESGGGSIVCGGIRPVFLGSAADSAVWGRPLAFRGGAGTVVHGPSGSGKSTFLRILYGLEDRYEGSLSIDGIDPAADPCRHWPRLRSSRLALLSQHFHLFPEEDGPANWGRLPRRHPDAGDGVLRSWAERLGIGSILGRPAATWSSGQSQRFALLRALASPFGWLLLDEPYSHLDPVSAAASHALAREVCAERGAGWILTAQTADAVAGADAFLAV